MSRALVRCEGGPHVGMGHVVRSTALAQELRARGYAVTFAMGEGSTRGKQYVEERGFAEIASSDALYALARSTDVVIVDHYGTQPDLLAELAAAAPLVVIDDEAIRDLAAASIIVNQNLGSDGLPYPNDGGTKLLLGPKYALLRPEFVRARESLTRTFQVEDHRLIITFGGGDCREYVLAIAAALEEVGRRLDILALGIEALPFASKHHVTPIRSVDDMPQRMAASDLIVTAGGTTCWEICAMKLPAVAIAIVGNQQGVVAGLQERGAVIGFSTFEDARRSVARIVDDLFGNARNRAGLAERAGALVDGLGARRVADAITSVVERK